MSTSRRPEPRRSTCIAQSLAETRFRSGFPLLRALVCSPRVVEPARPTLQLAGAGGTLIGTTAACGILGTVAGWALGSWPLGLMVGLVIGIPVGIFEAPRPAPGRLLPAIAAAGLLVLALPVFLVADLPLGGWVLASVLWLAAQGLSLLLVRLGLGADRLAASGVVGIGMTLRSVAVGVVLVAVVASDARLGLSAALLYALAYTLELGVSLAAYFGQESTR